MTLSLLLWIFRFLGCFSFFPHLSRGCGVNVHEYIALSSVRYVVMSGDSDLIEAATQHTYAMTAGSVFPDLFYHCSDHRDISEIMHWRTFHASLIASLRNKEISDTDVGEGTGSKDEVSRDELLRRLAFLMGLTSHYIADVTWHGLGQLEGIGFLRYSGIADFGCRGELCSSAHQSGDVGGESVLLVQKGSDVRDPSWDVPSSWVRSVVNQNQSNPVSYWDITRCMWEMAAVRKASQISAKVGYESMMYENPFLVEAFPLFGAGGLMDMIAQTYLANQKTAEWYRDPQKASGNLPQCLAQPSSVDDTKGLKEVMKRNLKASSISPRALSTSSRASHLDFAWTEDTYALEGFALGNCDVDGDGDDELLIGSPGRTSADGKVQAGRVEVKHLTRHVSIFIEGPSALSRFGQSLECGRFDLTSGLHSIIVGAPQLSSHGWNFTCERVEPRGGVFVFSSLDMSTNATFKATELNHVLLAPPSEKDEDGRENAPTTEGAGEGRDRFDRFGEVVTVGDADGDGDDDVLIGSPDLARSSRPPRDDVSIYQQGYVAFFEGRQIREGLANLIRKDEENEKSKRLLPAKIINSPERGDAFGAAILIIPVPTPFTGIHRPESEPASPSLTLVCIGAPRAGAQSRGKVYIYIDPFSPSPSSQSSSTLHSGSGWSNILVGTKERDRFGASLASLQSTKVYHQKRNGRSHNEDVEFVMPLLETGNKSITTSPSTVLKLSEPSYASGGPARQMVQLIVGQPGVDISTGATKYFQLSVDSADRYIDAKDDGDNKSSSPSQGSFFGRTMLVNSDVYAVSEPMKNEERGGVMYVNFRRRDSPPSFRSPAYVRGEEVGERLGSALTLTRVPSAKKNILWMGSPLASKNHEEQRKEGKVTSVDLPFHG